MRDTARLAGATVSPSGSNPVAPLLPSPEPRTGGRSNGHVSRGESRRPTAHSETRRGVVTAAGEERVTVETDYDGYVLGRRDGVAVCGNDPVASLAVRDDGDLVVPGTARPATDRPFPSGHPGGLPTRRATASSAASAARAGAAYGLARWTGLGQ